MLSALLLLFFDAIYNQQVIFALHRLTVRQLTDAAYEQLFDVRLLEAQTKDIWCKPASWGGQDRLTFFVFVISLAIKVSAYLANTCVGVQYNC